MTPLLFPPPVCMLDRLLFKRVADNPSWRSVLVTRFRRQAPGLEQVHLSDAIVQVGDGDVLGARGI